MDYEGLCEAGQLISCRWTKNACAYILFCCNSRPKQWLEPKTRQILRAGDSRNRRPHLANLKTTAPGAGAGTVILTFFSDSPEDSEFYQGRRILADYVWQGLRR